MSAEFGTDGLLDLRVVFVERYAGAYDVEDDVFLAAHYVFILYFVL